MNEKQTDNPSSENVAEKSDAQPSAPNKIFSFVEYCIIALALGVTLFAAVRAFIREDIEGPPVSLAWVASMTLLVTVVLFLCLYGIRILFDRLEKSALEAIRSRIGKKSISDLVGDPLAEVVSILFDVVTVLSYLVVVVLYVPVASSFFPRTRDIGESLLSYLIEPIKKVGETFVESIPAVFGALVITWIGITCIRIMRAFAQGVEQREIRIRWLPADSAMSLFQIARIAVVLFILVSIFNRLPGSDSLEFRAVAGFAALLFTLSSTSVAGNFVAGIVLSFMRPFRVGDRVKIGSNVGDVVESSTLVTRLITPTNERISIPNLIVLGGEIVNYSTLGNLRGVGISIPITIGYDVPRTKVHKLLEQAAAATDNIEEHPPPVVLQRELGDFSIRYELRAFTKQPKRIIATESELIGKIIDEFNTSEVEILSPIYQANRDGEKLALA